MRSNDEEKAKDLQQVAWSVVQFSVVCGPMFSTEDPLRGHRKWHTRLGRQGPPSAISRATTFMRQVSIPVYRHAGWARAAAHGVCAAQCPRSRARVVSFAVDLAAASAELSVAEHRLVEFPCKLHRLLAETITKRLEATGRTH